MARSGNLFRNLFLPVGIFVPMSVMSYQILFGQLRKAGLFNPQTYCPVPSEGKLPFQLPYLGGYVPQLEQVLCAYVSVFHPLFYNEITPAINYFLASLTACVGVSYLEASRRSRPLLLAYPTVIGLLMQVLSGGAVLPLYWAFFLAMTRDDAAGSQIDQADAEAVLFGIGMGYVLPTVAMSYYATPYIIACWQAFPVIIDLFLQIHLWLRPRHVYNTSGYRTVQATYALIFIGTAISHLRMLAAYNFDLQTITRVVIPSLAIPDAAKGHTSLTSIVHFFQWDFVFIFGSTLLASLWFAESIPQGILLMVWNVLSSLVLGPGAAISGVFLWREARLNKARLEATKQTKVQ